MLETKFKIALLLTVLFLTSLPVMGILRGTSRPPEGPEPPAASPTPTDAPLPEPGVAEPVVAEDMVLIPAGRFELGTTSGGFDERPTRTINLDAYWIDRHEVTQHHYAQFVAATGHRKAAPPSRYAKNISKMTGENQPIMYVSWEDAEAYCRWKGKRLPTEAEWEKAMRGADGRLWPWGNQPDMLAANWGSVKDGYEGTAPVGSFPRDVSPFGVADGAGNIMEWVGDWYGEQAYRAAPERNPTGPEHGVYRVLRGGGYTTTGHDIRITSRSKMVPDFRDETIGFRCARSWVEGDRGGQAEGERNSQKIEIVQD